jgi:hypothetical protein
MPDAQQLLTLAIVLAAAGYLVRRVWKRLSGRRVADCGSCSRCAGAVCDGPPAAKPFEPLEVLTTPVARDVDARSSPNP